MVRRRAGWSGAPPVNSGSRLSSLVRRAEGETTRSQAAASSIASGSPSSRRQISSTAAAFPASSLKSGRTWRARSTKSAIASYVDN
jgi:hypothetical protein